MYKSSNTKILVLLTDVINGLFCVQNWNIRNMKKCELMWIRKEDVEKFKNKDMLETLMIEMAADYPELEKVIVDERDKFLTYSLQNCAGFEIDKTGLKPNSYFSSN